MMLSNPRRLGIPFLLLSALACGGCSSSSSPSGGGGDGGSADGSTDGTVAQGDSTFSDAPTTGDTSLTGDSNPGTFPEAGVADAISSDGTTVTTDGATAMNDGTAPTSCASLPLCDDFESDTAGSAPSAALWTLAGTAGCSGVGNPGASTIYPIVVDNTQHHSGANSIKVSGGDGCGPMMVNTSAFAKLGGGDVYGRFYVFLSSTSMTFDHTVFGALNLGSTALNTDNQGTYLELASEGAGNPTNVFMWQTMDNNILPDKQTSGGAASTYPTAGAWTCVEFHTAMSGTLETWVNGTAITGLTFIPGTTAVTSGVNNAWTPISPFSPTGFGLGWVVFSGPMTTLWYDDVALSTTRIGCN